MHKHMIVAVLSSATWVACGGQGTQPDDMSAAEHRQAAAGDEASADEHESRYDPDSRATLGTSTAATSDVFYGLDSYNPTEAHLGEAQALRDQAEQHREAAAALERYEDEQCARFPPATRPSCPLLGQVASVEDVDGGVRLHFVDGVRVDAVADHMRCHLAYARTQGRQGMDHCPLYLEGVSVERADDVVTLTTNAGAEGVAELRRRARAHVAH